MIFNINEKDEKKVYEILKEECGFNYGIILSMNDITLLESNIPETDLNIDIPKGKNPRYIMIGYSGSASHGGRMKVSDRKRRISHNSKYISIYVSNENNGTVKIEGNPKDIDMKNKELDYYKDLCLRHNNLIQCAKDPDTLELVEKALIEDENRYKNGIKYTRNKQGNLLVYDDNGKLHKYNLEGDEI